MFNYRKQVEREFSGKYGEKKDSKFMPRGSGQNILSHSLAGQFSLCAIPRAGQLDSEVQSMKVIPRHTSKIQQEIKKERLR